MLETASKCRNMLDPDALSKIAGFIASRQAPDGGYRGRGDSSDVYYTAFAVESLLALGSQLPEAALRGYIAGLGSVAALDLPHLASLARLVARLPGDSFGKMKSEIPARMEEFRAADGGYGLRPDCGTGSAYGGFLALITAEDLDCALPDPTRLVKSISALELDSGGFSGERGLDSATTTTTVSALVVFAKLGGPISKSSLKWLAARFDPETAGFRATDKAPVPDLLSSATALFAIVQARQRLPSFLRSIVDSTIDLDKIRGRCAGFIQSLWDESGGFCGSHADPIPDCEYTYYGLLGLGCLG